MGEAKLYGKSSTLNIEGLIQDYYVYAGETITAGSFVEFIQGVKSSTTASSKNFLIKTNHNYELEPFILSDTRVLVFYSTGINEGYYLSALILEITGITVSVLSDTVLSSSEHSGDNIKAVQIDTNKYFIAHTYRYSASSNYLSSMIVSVSGTTITVGATKRLISRGGADESLQVHKLSSTNVIVIHGYPSGDVLYRYGCIVSVSGSTIAVGTDTKLVDTADISINEDFSALLSGDRVFSSYGDISSDSIYANIYTVSGKTISTGSPALIKQGKTTHRGILLQDNKVLITYAENYQSLVKGVICNINTSTITPGTEFTVKTNVYGYGIHHSFAKLDINKFVLLYAKDDGSTYKECLGGCLFKVENDVLISYSDVILDSTNYSALAVRNIVPISSDKILFFGAQSSSANWHASMLGIDNIQNVPTTTVITSATYETQVRNATSPTVNGVAKTSGTGGTRTAHGGIVSVYTPNI